MRRKHAEIFQEIVRHKSYVPVKSLSETFQVSARTIRYALEEIDDYLRDHHQPLLKRNRKKGVYYDCDQEVIHKLLGSDTLHFLDAADREAFLVFAFFYAKEKVTVPSICEHLQVSKSTVDKDIQRLRTELLADNLRLDSLPKEGFAVVGSEFAKRRWLFRFLKRACRNRGLDMLKQSEAATFFEEYCCKLVEATALEQTLAWIRSIEQKKNGRFTYETHLEIGLYALLALKRIKMGYLLTEKAIIPEQLDKQAFALAQTYDFQKPLSDPNTEIYVLSLFLSTAKEEQFLFKMEGNWGQIQVAVMDFVHSITKQTGLPFINDQEYFSNIYAHIQTMARRLKNELPIENPIADVIVKQYPDLFAACRLAGNELERTLQLTIPIDEIAYLTMHTCVASERLKRQTLVYRTVIICGHGITNARLIEESLYTRFSSIEVLGTLSRYEVDVIQKLQVDFVLTTLPLSIKGVPCLQVSPFFKDEDTALIQTTIAQIAKSKQKQRQKHTATNEDFFRSIVEIAKANSKSFMLKPFMEELTSLFKKHQLPIYEGVIQPLLAELMSEDHIELNVRAANWQEAIYAAAKPLERSGAITKNYAEAMIASVQEYGPYIVLAPGVAIAHARPEDGVNELSVSFIQLAEPIPFGNPDNDPVFLVICLAASDSFSHLKAFRSIVKLINDEQRLDAIKAATSKQTLTKIVLNEEGEKAYVDGP
ncbi:BglG family transcription antiterminator [Shouchella clausii]|jgi:mannitol operon transcriptional antiterminator|uniref:BglG family transcription antiterminator n=1 Tax=Shouchella clausii TaxID=79880 RepID=UPI000B9648A8|nr:PTS sugar transporter subunit IIA [Shouchella clausii]AST96288.1 hypothetical protein BC8716_10165 [Shouchella clausii]MEB5473554.1 PTS sugar transporter subunit IIA [Shouchella clausii]QNM42647.1 PRD domain-containing protein [Shouchella clausii]WQG94501.1 PTS sugar transporter subunit IIA [Shouchella clausii]